ncbi:MAG TPA: tumor necrosis factor receptor family protein, partial [Polyangiaceae bacterium]|nr:tumor necrosis factor receptor family protein [Polyangiaceae bacterium]
FGKDVEVQPSTPIYHRPPDWDAAINGPSHVTWRWMDGSAILRAADPPSPEGVADAHVTLPELIAFTIPRRLRVTQGNAGNRSAALKYRDGQNGVVTCTYRGGASVADPTTGSIDEARGLHYDLVNCSNGALGGSSALGSEFWLTIDGCASLFGGFTMVEVHLNGCGGALEPPMEPEDSVALVEGFSWQSTAPVPEVDAEGRPSLYYALIYLEDPEQLAALDDALIHWDPMPLFQSELDRFDGQCGSVQGVFDGEGVFVYAMLPGVTYNLLRSYALSPYVDPDTGDDQTIFDVVILRAPPPEAANPDGSVSWEALEDSAFLYLGVTELESVDDEQQQPRRKGKFRKFCRNVARAVGGAVREVVRGVVLVLGQASLLLGRDCDLAVTVQVNNRDPAFPGEMTQAWGADPWVVDPSNPNDPDRPPPRAARPTDTKVDVKLTFASLLGPLPSLPMPTLFSSKTNSRGIAHLTVPRSDQLNGVQPRGLRGPICVHLKNDAASITNYLLYDRVCGFDSGGLHLNRSESNVRVITDHKRLHLWNSLLDANRYLSKVAEYPAQPVQVLTGWVANGAGFPPWGDHAAFAGCLGLNQREDLFPLYLAVIPALENLLPTPHVLDLPTLAASAMALPLSRADIVYPDNTERHRNSRGVVSHEYGHFALCSLLYDRNPDLLNMFLKDRIQSGGTIEATDEVSVLSDAFADFVAAQVVGGVDYPDPSQILWSNGVSYCAWTATGLPCMEGNANGLDTSGEFLHMDGGDAATAAGYLELARVGTIWHDAFDGHYVQGLPRNANVPGNADYYNVTGASLQLRNTGWVTLHGALRDENVSLPGTVIDDWVQSWLPMEDFPHFSVGGAMAALAATMYDQGVTWCDACELFALHEAGTPLTPFNDLWNACTQGRLAGYLGVPPDDRLNMDPTDCEPCGPLFYVDPTDGICKPCPAGEVAITGGCEPCPSGQVPRADGSCDACADDQFAQGNVCVDCPDGWLRDGASNTCVPCPTDLVVDWPTAGATCEPTVIPVDTAPAANDACPGDLIVEVTGLSSGGPLIPAVTSPE